MSGVSKRDETDRQAREGRKESGDREKEMLDEGDIKSEYSEEEERESHGMRKGNERRRNEKKDERRREKREIKGRKRQGEGKQTRGDDSGVGWLIRERRVPRGGRKRRDEAEGAGATQPLSTPIM